MKKILTVYTSLAISDAPTTKEAGMRNSNTNKERTMNIVWLCATVLLFVVMNEVTDGHPLIMFFSGLLVFIQFICLTFNDD